MADLAVDTFAPTGLDVHSWVDAIASSGAKYAMLSAKHTDGFCLWPTAYAAPAHDPYSIAQTAWYANNGSPDVVSQFVTQCRAHSINPCLYFSVYDRTYEARTGTTAATGWENYMLMIEAQLTELLSNYGDLTAIWIDAWDSSNLGITDSPTGAVARVWDLVKTLQPNCLFIMHRYNIPNYYSQVSATEGFQWTVGNTLPFEKVISIRSDGKWFYNATLDQTAAALRGAAYLNNDIANFNANYQAYLLGIMPTTAGVLTAAQIARMAELSV